MKATQDNNVILKESDKLSGSPQAKVEEMEDHSYGQVLAGSCVCEAEPLW